jgi:GNAT superfamily N-acetyltransferase
MSTTGKAVARDAGSVVAAAAFDADRTDADRLRLRYITVRDDRRGDGTGPRLAGFVAEEASVAGYDRVAIAVNNPYAYEAMYRAGFGFTGETTGLAELVLQRPDGLDPDAYRAGLAEFRSREHLTDDERAFVERHGDRGPPALLDE